MLGLPVCVCVCVAGRGEGLLTMLLATRRAIYSRTSMARTLMARLPRLFRTRS